MGKGSRPLFNSKPPEDLVEPKKTRKRASKEMEEPSEDTRPPSPFLNPGQEDTGKDNQYLIL